MQQELSADGTLPRMDETDEAYNFGEEEPKDFHPHNRTREGGFFQNEKLTTGRSIR